MSHHRLDWAQGAPRSAQFDDVFFQPGHGVAESTHVFINANNLHQRLLSHTGPFAITELGFGTGLNFMLAWQLWHQAQAHNPNLGVLRFTSCERYPLSLDDMTQAHAALPEGLTPYADDVRSCWQQVEEDAGFHVFMLGSVELSLFMGDVHTMLQAVDDPAHAWFLDGFAPAKNPDMWQTGVFDEMARLSRPARGSESPTTFATFTAAGHVRRGLEAAGFTVEKTPGYGTKRDMLKGTFTGD